MPIRPMLAAKADLTKLKYPVCVSPKIDGVRAIVWGGIVYSRSGKPIPNRYVQDCLCGLNGHDGEITVGKPYGEGVFARTTSGVMTKEGKPDFTFNVFDLWDTDRRYRKRYELLTSSSYQQEWPSEVRLVHTTFDIFDEETLLGYEQRALEEGYEGLMIRKQDAFYKFGRSTVKEGGLLKLKRFSDSEAVVVGYEELMRNGNVAKKDELGYTVHGHAKAGEVAMGVLGALIVRDWETGVEFSIGSGFSMADRAELWEEKETLIGRTVKYKYFSVGTLEKPRFPIFIGFRDERDM